MSDKIFRFTAIIVAAVLIFCFASCGDDSGEETTTVPAPIYTAGEESTTAPSEAPTTNPKKTSEPDKELSTVILTTVPGGEIPTVVTSQWNTTLPQGVTPVNPYDVTSMYLTVPGDYTAAPPPVYSSVAITTAPTTEMTTTSSIPTTDVITQTDPNGNTVTVYSTDGTTQPVESDSTAKKEPQAINLVESGLSGFESSGALTCELEGTGLPESFKVTSAKVNVTVNGTVIKNIQVTAASSLNEDGRVEITLKTNSSQVQMGDSVQFTLPEGFIKANDGMLYSNAKEINIFA